MAKLGPDQISALRTETPKARARDFAASLGITEADLVAAFVGTTATVVTADPDRLLPWIGRLGEVMDRRTTVSPLVSALTARGVSAPSGRLEPMRTKASRTSVAARSRFVSL